MSFSLILYNETRKRMLILWDYKSNILTQIFMMILIFVGATFLIGGGQFHPDQITSMLLGYIVWYYARLVITNTSSEMLAESQIGTLEQIYMSPAHPAWILLARMFVLLLTSTVIVILPTILIATPLGIHFPFRWEGLVIFAITLVGLFGFALALSGAALVFKQIDTLADLIQNVLLFLTGSLVPITHFPQWLFVFAQTLPITQGISVLRNVVLDGQPLSVAWNNGSLLWLLVNSLIYLCIGRFAYVFCERYAKKKGTLGQY
ncbi:MAG TPA: ABC transporter permease [Ktedonobacteraceae bacterium]|nr:ABC transporter permease [Ktedonobacteraceae bacterium]